MGLGRALWDRRFGVPVALYITLFSVVPVALLALHSAAPSGWGGLQSVLADPLTQRALDNSLEQGALSAAGAWVGGTPLGLLLARFEWPGRSTVRSVLLVPFLLPSVVMVLGVQELFGSSGTLGGVPLLGQLAQGVPGIVLVNVLFDLPLVALLTAAGIESASAGAEETAALLGAGPVRRWRDVWGLGAAVGGACGAVLTFLFSFLTFAPPILLCGPRCYTLEGWIFALDQTLLEPAAAAWLAVVVVLLLLAPAALYLALLDRLQSSREGRTRRPPRLDLRSVPAIALVAVAAVPLLAEAALVGELLVRGAVAAAPGGGAGSAWAYLAAGSVTDRLGITTGAAAANSVVFALAAAAIALLCGIVAGAGRRTGGLLRAYRWIPLLISPVILSLAVSTVWEPWLGGAAGVALLIVLAQAALALPLALAGLDVALRQVPGRLRESASVLGATPLQSYVDAELGRIRPALATSALLASALGMGEFTATNFLTTGSTTTLPVELYDLLHLRAVGPAEAVAAVLVAVSLVLFLALERGRLRLLA